MLRQRVITAVVLLCVLLPAMFYKSPNPFCAAALVLIAAGGWEWGRLNVCSPPTNIFLGLTTALLCGLVWYAGLLDSSLGQVWLLIGGAWVLLGAALLRGGVSRWPKIPKWVRLPGGLAALCFAWVAVAQARIMGISFLLSVLLLVWVADIAAYAAGRAFGGKFTQQKLAPAISPGKSWEGVWGGMAGVVLLALFWGFAERSGISLFSGSLYAQLWSRHGVWVMLLSVLFLAAMSVVGDLVESLVKRSAGVKDSSGLLPGHGGVLDRVDALLPAVPLAMMLVNL